MTCARLYRYVELNPMRAYGPRPGDYPRSSHGHKKQGLTLVKVQFQKSVLCQCFLGGAFAQPDKGPLVR